MASSHTSQKQKRIDALSNISIGAGHLPVPMRLAKKIESGAFMELSDLLPELMGIHRRRDDHRSKCSKRFLAILEWLQRFSTYVSVVSRNHPDHIPDIMGYQSLIIEASMDDCWAGYDRRYRQQVASHPSTTWSINHPTLWSLAFTGRAKVSRCSYCFSLSHRSADCELSPD